MTADDLSDELLCRAAVRAEYIRLAQVPREEEIEHVFSKRFERKMRALIRQQRRTPFANTAVRVTKRTALVFSIAVLLMLTTVLSVGAWRARFFRLLREAYEKYTEIRFEITDEGASAWNSFEIYAPAYIPDGYALTSSLEQPEFGVVMYKYENSSGGFILYYQSFPGGVVQYNTEHDEMVEVEIGEESGLFLSVDGSDMVLWTDSQYVFQVVTALGEKETLRIAESVKKQDF